jgi:hypothetical protein
MKSTGFGFWDERRRFVRMIMVMLMLVTIMIVIAVTMVVRIGLMRYRIGRLVSVIAFEWLRAVGGIKSRAFNHFAPDPVAMSATASPAMARTPALRTIFGFFFGFAVGAFVGLDQSLTVGDRDLIIVRMNFAERKKTVAIAAVFNEGGLQRRLNARYLGEIDIPAELLALRGFEIKLFDAIAADHHDPGFFRMGGIDQHLVGHLKTLGGGTRICRPALCARRGYATVHLIRG